MKIKTKVIILCMLFLFTNVRFFEGSLITKNQYYTQSDTFSITNKTIQIRDITIYEGSFDLSVFVFNNESSDDLLVMFNRIKTVLQAGQTYHRSESKRYDLNFQLSSNGTANGLYEYTMKITYFPCDIIHSSCDLDSQENTKENKINWNLEFFGLGILILVFFIIMRKRLTNK